MSSDLHLIRNQVMQEVEFNKRVSKDLREFKKRQTEDIIRKRDMPPESQQVSTSASSAVLEPALGQEFSTEESTRQAFEKYFEHVCCH